MTQPVTLRPVTLEDGEFLFRVYASTRQEELAQVAWTDEQKAVFLKMQFDAQYKYYSEYYPGALFQIILYGGAPAGRLYIARWEKEIRIMDITLLPGSRNQGIGAYLLKQILAEGEQRQLPVSIHVERFNPALRLYTRLGFHQIEDKGVYLLMEWKPDAG